MRTRQSLLFRLQRQHKVKMSGAKNAALAILAAAIMADEPVTIENVPDVRDTRIVLDAIKEIGAIVERVDKHTYAGGVVVVDLLIVWAVQFTQQQLIMNISRRLERLIIC